MKSWSKTIDLGCSARNHKFKNSNKGTRSARKFLIELDSWRIFISELSKPEINSIANFDGLDKSDGLDEDNCLISLFNDFKGDFIGELFSS